MLDSAIPCRKAALETLPGGSWALGIRLRGQQIEDYGRLASLLIEGNERVNLTAITDPIEIMQRHILDSLTAAPLLQQSPQASIVDVGTGGGFPGLALAIYWPSWRITLLDSVGKKTAFLERCVQELNLTNVRVVTGRAEEYAAHAGSQAFGIAVARAVAPTPTLIEYCAPLVRAVGRIVLYKNGDQNHEVSEAQRVAPLLGCSVGGVHPVAPDVGVGDDRFLIEIVKKRRTPEGFPRRTGLAKHQPL